jgi:hypothetical protein
MRPPGSGSAKSGAWLPRSGINDSYLIASSTNGFGLPGVRVATNPHGTGLRKSTATVEKAPLRLKPAFLAALNGTAKAVPFPNSLKPLLETTWQATILSRKLPEKSFAGIQPICRSDIVWREPAQYRQNQYWPSTQTISRPFQRWVYWPRIAHHLGVSESSTGRPEGISSHVRSISDL